MDWLVFIMAAVALLLGLGARSRLNTLQSRVDDMKREQSMRSGDADELKKDVDSLRKIVALMAGGKPVDAEMVKENRLYRNVAVDALQKRFEGGDKPYVLDVRTDQEWSGGHISGAVHIPVDNLEKRLNEVARDGREIFITCAGGGRSTSAADYLANRGFLNVYNVEGGMNGWRGEVVRD